MKITLDVSRRQAELLKQTINYLQANAINDITKSVSARTDMDAPMDWAAECQEEYYLVQDIKEQINKHIKGDN